MMRTGLGLPDSSEGLRYQYLPETLNELKAEKDVKFLVNRMYVLLNELGSWE